MEVQNFSIDFNSTQVKGNIMPAQSRPKVVILHGAGTAAISRYASLRELLAEQGIASCAFDYPGHGETGGSLEGSSLKERTEVTLEIIKQLGLAPKVIIGSSMGAYTAIRLLEHYDIEKLILFVPAIYSDESYKLLFGEEFRTAIRRPGSWKDSKAWELLAAFRGRLLIVQAEQDEVIPAEIIDRIYGSVINCQHREKYILRGAPHGFTRHLNDNQEQLKEIADKLAFAIK